MRKKKHFTFICLSKYTTPKLSPIELKRYAGYFQNTFYRLLKQYSQITAYINVFLIEWTGLHRL